MRRRAIASLRSASCGPISRRYGPSRAISSAWLPLSTTRAVLQHQDPVGADHAGQAVRQDQRRAAGHQPVERLLDHRLVLGIDRRQRLVEHQDRRIPQQRTGDGEALALPAGEPRAALADDGLIAVWQRVDEVMRVRGARGGDQLLVAGVGPAEPQIVLDRAVEQIGVLRDDGDHPARLLRDRACAGRGRQCGSCPLADRAGAAAGARWSICPRRSGRRCRRARRRRSQTRGRDGPRAARQDRRSATSSNAMLVRDRPEACVVRAAGRRRGDRCVQQRVDAVRRGLTDQALCSTVRRSRSGRKISVPAISTISSASRLISPCAHALGAECQGRGGAERACRDR